MGAKHTSEDEEYYDDELDGKSTDGIVDKWEMKGIDDKILLCFFLLQGRTVMYSRQQ